MTRYNAARVSDLITETLMGATVVQGVSIAQLPAVVYGHIAAELGAPRVGLNVLRSGIRSAK
jgi:hypothetical protein